MTRSKRTFRRPALPIALALPLLHAVPSLHGEEWVVLGPRAMGMGGAGVAATRGSLASYWNPANLGIRWRRWETEERPLDFGIEIPATVSVGVAGDVLRDVDRIFDQVKDLDFDAIEQDLDDGGGFDTGDLQTLLSILASDVPKLNQRGKGVIGNAGAGLAFRTGRFAFSALAVGHAGGRTFADLTASGLAFGDEGMAGIVGAGNDRTGDFSNPGSQGLADSLASSYGITQDQAEEFVYQAEQAGVDTSDATARQVIDAIVEGTTAGGVTTDEFVTNNDSGVNIRALLMNEFGLTYAQPLLDGRLAVGASLKLVYGITRTNPLRLRTLEDGGDVVDELLDDESQEESFRVSADAGITVHPLPFLAVGIVGRHLTRPRFKAAGEDYQVDPQVRAGVALFPTSWITLAADLDVARNRSEALPGYRSQVAGGGAEVVLFRTLALRAGISKNLASSEGLTLHAGFGLDIAGFHIEAAAASSTERQPIETDGSTTKIPERAGLSAILGVETVF